MKKTAVYLVAVVAMLLSLNTDALAAGGGAKKDDPNAPKPEFAYIQMDPISLPVITAKGLTQQVSLMVSVEVKYDDKEKITEFKPRLADAYIQDLYGAIGAGYGMMKVGNANIIDVQKIKQRLTAITEKVLAPEHKAHDVLLQVVQQRAL